MQVFNCGSKLRYTLILFVLMAFFSCQRNTFFFVKNEGAVMPVKISGNTESSIYIVLLPGGPAGDGLVYRRIFPLFRKFIEPNYQMVYCDQRGAGNCQGIYDTTSLNLQQLSEDLDKVVSVIKEENKQAQVYLLGYSYGGALGFSYLLNPAYQAKINGFISVEGAFDRRLQSDYQNQFVEHLLEQWVEEGYLDSYDAMKNGYTCDGREDEVQCKKDSVEVVAKVAARLDEIENYNQFKVNGASIRNLLSYTFFSQSNPITSGMNEGQNGKYYQTEFDNLLLSDQVEAIKTPMLLISGKFDTNVPFFDAQKIYERIGTPTQQKSLILLERSGHLPMITEPEELVGHILQFIEQNE